MRHVIYASSSSLLSNRNAEYLMPWLKSIFTVLCEDGCEDTYGQILWRICVRVIRSGA